MGRVNDLLDDVARFTRAWIETLYVHVTWFAFEVARFTRAWIETGSGSTSCCWIQRRPLHAGVD